MSFFHNLLSAGITSPFAVFNKTNSSWWRASVGVTAPGDIVDTVVDQGDMARNLTGLTSFKPTLGTDSNGNKFFNFNSKAFTFNALNYGTIASDYFFIAVIKWKGNTIPTAGEGRLFTGTNGTRLTINAGANIQMPPVYQCTSNVSAFVSSKQGMIPERLHVVALDFSEPFIRVWINGVLNTNNATVAYVKQIFTSVSPYRIGMDDTNTRPIIANVYEMFFTKGTYTDAQKMLGMSYFNNLYNASFYDKSAFLPNNKNISQVSEIKILDTTGQPATYDYVFNVLCSLDSSERLHITYTRGSNHNNNSDQKVIYRYTDDYGVTVSPEQVILTANASSRYNPSQAFRTASGRILLSYTTINYIAGTFFANMQYSDDNGNSWNFITGDGPNGLITDHFGPPGYVVGTGNMIQLANGDILHSLYGQATDSGNRGTIVVKSTDDGQTWTFLATMAPPTARDYEETCIYHGMNGLIMALMRSDQGSAAFISYSWDSGATWIFGPISITDRPVAFPSVGFNGASMNPGTNGVLSYGRALTPDTGRTQVHYSQDGGYTFPIFQNESSRTGINMYGKFEWSPILGQFVGCHGEENVGSPAGLGPCSVFVTRYVEV